MNPTTSRVRTFAIILSLAACRAIAVAAAPVLPGTAPLTLEEPLDEVMVAGIDRFALRELAAAPARRGTAWQRDFSNVETYRRSLAPQRERLREIIGAVDPRVGATDFELLATLGRDATVGDAGHFTVLAVRWQVLKGVTGEGLLLHPTGPLRGRAVVLPDADWTPEQFVGLASGVVPQAQLPRRLAAQGWQVLVPMLISRSDEFSGHAAVRFTNQPHREFIYRQAFELGRHVIGYEVQKVLAAVDIFTAADTRAGVALPVAVAGVGEGGLLTLYSAALDERIQRTLVSGYFEPREGVWQEPIYRNVWGLLDWFGDAELAGMVAPRRLVIEACAAPEIAGPPTARPGRAIRGSAAASLGRDGAAAPGRIRTPELSAVRSEFERAKPLFARLNAADHLKLAVSGSGNGPAGSADALKAFLGSSLDAARDQAPIRPSGASVVAENAPAAREKRQFDEMQVHVQNLLRVSGKVRDARWAKASSASLEKWSAGVEPLRDWVYDELIGRLPKPTAPLNVRTRLVTNAGWLKGHEGAFDAYEVVLDVFEDVIASGILLLPRNLRPGEKRPVVVCQHGLEGRPEDTIAGPEAQPYRAYKSFSAELCKRGFIVYAPQNPYRGWDRFRTLQRKSNVLGRSLFSYIIPQHERTLEWLGSLPFVDASRIAFYGLSYGGKTAMRVPPFVKAYCLSICSGDFNEWVRKNASNEDPFSYMFTHEYEIFEWNMGHVANYAELALLMTPRPFMVERGHNDGVAIDEWVAWEYAKVRRHYNKLGIGDRTEIEYFNGPHTINGQGSFRFLHRHLNWPAVD